MDAIEKKMITLGPDPLWEGFEDVEYQDLLETAAEITSLREEIPDEVRGRLDVAGKLIAHSYFEYDFLDAAVDRALLTFEMALERRLEEIGREVGDRDSLFKLIEWGDEEYLFERDKSSIHALRRIRNSMAAHPSMDSRIGPPGISLIRDIVYHINQMYEDRWLREERKSKRATLQESLNEVVEDGAVMEEIPEEGRAPDRLLIYKIEVLLIDNWEEPLEYVVGACPIFDPFPNEEGQVRIPKPIYIRAESWEKSENAIILIADNGEIAVRPIEKSENEKRFQEKWKNPIEETDREVLSSALLRLGQARRALQFGDPIPRRGIILGKPITSRVEPGNSELTFEFGPDGLQKVEE